MVRLAARRAEGIPNVSRDIETLPVSAVRLDTPDSRPQARVYNLVRVGLRTLSPDKVDRSQSSEVAIATENRLERVEQIPVPEMNCGEPQ